MPSPYTLYTGGYADRSVFTLSFDPTQDEPQDRLVVTDSLQHGRAPTWLTFSQDGSKLYTTSEWSEPEGEIKTLAVGSDGLREDDAGPQASTGGLWACHTGLVTSTKPHLLVTANYKGPSLSVVPLQADGTFTGASSFDVLPGRALGPVDSRQESPHPHGAHVDPLGRVVVVPDLGTDDLRLFKIKPEALAQPGAPASAALEEYDAIHLEAGDGPRHVLFSPVRKSGSSGGGGGDEALLYVLNELSNSLSVLLVTYPATRAPALASASAPTALPTFTLLQSRISLLPSSPFPHQPSFATWHAAELVLTPDGRTLIASNRAEGHDPLHGSRDGPQDLLAVFAVADDGRIDEGSRRLVECGGRAPRHLSLCSESVTRQGRGDAAVDKGRYLAVAAHDSDEVVIMERVGADGRELKEVARRQDVGRPGVVVWL
ncbi:uncharacterized protein RHOBADRAFT_51380 [Rhodotorula graminis WP1]|uniref:Uncharacterized protein n=1 Tax=Rhodotorula graminis (strain WP1) TaxID=578459 RepID=A0A194SDP9_RHOGW|nr:uncharacterized protein RHOBADRAFT_51380 [Rhodotorula graminis WP1]KPV77536.1 hypothetical protein RHOBADRAFT_51380 [Rhodotorula graminis WP1]